MINKIEYKIKNLKIINKRLLNKMLKNQKILSKDNLNFYPKEKRENYYNLISIFFQIKIIEILFLINIVNLN